MTLSRSAFPRERKEVHISRLTCYKQFESKPKGMKGKPQDGLTNAAMGAVFLFRKKQRPTGFGRTLWSFLGLCWRVLDHIMLTCPQVVPGEVYIVY